MENIALIRVMKFFLENPYKEVYLRQLAKEIKLSPYATKKYADLLIKENIIEEEKKANLRYFKANASNIFFKQLKIALSIQVILKSDLVTFLRKNITNISSIVLFGSMAKGEDDKDSDVDILIIGKEKYISLGKFEEKIGKDINKHIFSWSHWNKQAKDNKAFYFDVIVYGIPLYGELPIIK